MALLDDERDGEIQRGEARQAEEPAGEAGSGDPRLDARCRCEDDDGQTVVGEAEQDGRKTPTASAVAQDGVAFQLAQAGAWELAVFRKCPQARRGIPARESLTQFLIEECVESTQMDLARGLLKRAAAGAIPAAARANGPCKERTIMVEIVTNTLPAETQAKVADSVKAAIGFRPGLWQVTLLGSRNVPRFVVFIRHPEAGFNRSWVFEKPDDPIQRVVESGLTLAGWEADDVNRPA